MKANILSVAEAGLFSVVWIAILVVLAVGWRPAHGQEAAAVQLAPYAAQEEPRWGGVLEESYQYHRQAQPATAGRTGATPYRYGFPVSSFRWGWFGAARYYPTVFWHRGYNGDDCRYAYRCGY